MGNNKLTYLLSYLLRDKDKTNKKRRHTSRRKKKKVRSSRKTARHIRAMDADLQADKKRHRRRHEADDERDDEEEKEEDEEDAEDKEEEEEKDKEAEMERYNEFLVKKDINDYFAQSRNAADEEEVFDRSERADTASDRFGKSVRMSAVSGVYSS